MIPVHEYTMSTFFIQSTFFHILLIIKQNMKRQRQTCTPSFVHTLIQNVQTRENHTLVFLSYVTFAYITR